VHGGASCTSAGRARLKKRIGGPKKGAHPLSRIFLLKPSTINSAFIWPAPPAPTSLLLRFISGFEWLSSYATGSVKEMMNAFGGVMRRTALALDDVS
jgi:hypothetical protein